MGETELVVKGTVTGQIYRFPMPGAVLAVDFRDRRGLAQLSQLRLLRSG